jgi:hypothetical protein
MKRMKQLGAILALGSLVLAGLLVSPASAAPSGSANVFNSIPSTLPGNVSSVGFEATSVSEFGDYARFAGNKRSLQKVTVIMSSWGCESGTWSAGNCLTTPGATFSHDITLNLYANGGSGTVGALIGTATQTFAIPYRPSANINCTGGRWQASNATCYNGLATPITFNFSPGTLDTATGKLPASVIYGIVYNTTHYGPSPIGESAACFSTPAGCGYDSLNVSAASTTPKLGVDDDVNGIFQNSSWSGAYCDLGVTGTFRLDSPCWTGFNPMVKFVARH